MNFYLINKKLFVDTESGYLVQKNCVGSGEVLPIAGLDVSNVQRVKKQKAREMLNTFFANCERETWTFEGKKYWNGPNFKDIPSFDEYEWQEAPAPWYRYIVVYHQGRVFHFFHNGDGVGRLMDTAHKEVVKWTRIWNCSPVYRC
jgi:hypothetical protein